jgi:hypothetical protein
MKFSVDTKDGGSFYDGTYTVLDNGVLVIHPDDPYRPITRMSPTFWRQIDELRVGDPQVEETESGEIVWTIPLLSENQEATEAKPERPGQ